MWCNKQPACGLGEYLTVTSQFNVSPGGWLLGINFCEREQLSSKTKHQRTFEKIWEGSSPQMLERLHNKRKNEGQTKFKYPQQVYSVFLIPVIFSFEQRTLLSPQHPSCCTAALQSFVNFLPYSVVHWYYSLVAAVCWSLSWNSPPWRKSLFFRLYSRNKLEVCW